jgi:hypothetical protein
MRKIRKPTIDERVAALRARFDTLYDARKAGNFFPMLTVMACDGELLDEWEAVGKYLPLTAGPPSPPIPKRKRKPRPK